jgi:hypothetical protein
MHFRFLEETGCLKGKAAFYAEMALRLACRSSRKARPLNREKLSHVDFPGYDNAEREAGTVRPRRTLQRMDISRQVRVVIRLQ